MFWVLANSDVLKNFCLLIFNKLKTNNHSDPNDYDVQHDLTISNGKEEIKVEGTIDVRPYEMSLPLNLTIIIIGTSTELFLSMLRLIHLLAKSIYFLNLLMTRDIFVALLKI